MRKKFLPFVVACCCAVTSSFAQATYCGKVIGNYIPWWYNATQFAGINYNELTHAYFAFIGGDNSGNLCGYKWEGSGVKTMAFEGNPEIMPAFDLFKEKATAAKCKKIISIGGAGTDVYLQTLSKTASTRANFVTKIWDFVNRHNLDGIDMDWEALENADHQKWYGDLLGDIQKARPAGKLIVATVLASDYYGKWFPAGIVNSCDLVQLMAYDNTATWADSPAGNHSTIAHANAAMSYWGGKGTPANKMVLGLPFYGYQQKNSGGTKTADWTYKAFVAAYPTQFDNDNYAISSTETIGLNGPTTIKAKTALGFAKAGVMIWEGTQDLPYSDAKSLHRAIITKMKETGLCPNGKGNSSVKEVKLPVASSYYSAQMNQVRASTVKQGRVSVALYNVLGQEVLKSDLGIVAAGEYGVDINKAAVKAGVYIVTVTVGDERSSSKVYID